MAKTATTPQLSGMEAGLEEMKPLRARFATYKMLDGSRQSRLRRISDGSIIKRFEHTPLPKKNTDVVCPHFLELKWGYGCPYDCAWCFLKGTLRMLPEKTAPKTKDRLKVKRHVFSALRKSRKPELFNTGELCDSLMDERGKEPFSHWITEIFDNQESHKVLFLTKSSFVDRLIEIKNHDQAIVSFSLNADIVSKQWEKAPPVKDRIKAASRLACAGWDVRIRIDPMVPIGSWKKAYQSLVAAIFREFEPNRITLGTLRGLQSTLNNLTDDSWTIYLDSIRTAWGKKTPDGLREEMYSWMFDSIEPHLSLSKVGLCKETLAMFEALAIDFREQVCNCML